MYSQYLVRPLQDTPQTYYRFRDSEHYGTKIHISKISFLTASRNYGVSIVLFSQPKAASSAFNLQSLLAQVSLTFSRAHQQGTAASEFDELDSPQGWSISDIYGDSSW